MTVLCLLIIIILISYIIIYFIIIKLLIVENHPCQNRKQNSRYFVFRVANIGSVVTRLTLTSSLRD
jgi:hypothetical protein